MVETALSEGWLQPDGRQAVDPAGGEGAPAENSPARRPDCRGTRGGETRAWDRIVRIADGILPLDLIKSYSRGLPLPPFHSGQISLNKEDVECIATAMLDPNLRWHGLYHFTVAPYQALPAYATKPLIDRRRYNPADYEGQLVLINGHHRFLAFLLSGMPPPDPAQIKVTVAASAVTVFPWHVVEWGK